MEPISELERDAITEVLNVGVGHAASSLAELLQEEVLLSVPNFEVVTRESAAQELGRDAGNRISGVNQTFSGPFHGDALLLFPASKSLELIRAMMGDALPLDQLTEFEQEGLSEVGNIILNAVLGSLANIFEGEITCELPRFVQGLPREILAVDAVTEGNNTILFLWVDFRLPGKDITGYVAFLVDLQSLGYLRDHIRTLIGRHHG